MQLPHLIGICGNPKCGKSTLQKILERRFNVIPVDDGAALRDFAVCHLGLTWNQVHTQEGKAEYTDILGKPWQNRKILGELGAALENLFGEHIMPWMATQGLDPRRSYSFGSVRKTQAHFFKQRGGLILGITNPLAPASPYAFDAFDMDAVDVWIHNDAQALGINGEAGEQRFEDRLLIRLAEHFADMERA